MKTFASIGGVHRKDIGDDAFAHLCDIVPPGWRESLQHSFRCMLDVDGPVLDRVLAALQDSGYCRRDRGIANRRDAKLFDFTLHRRYDEGDLADCQLLELRALPGAFHGIERDASGLAIIPEWLLPGELDIDAADFFEGYGNPTWIFVPDRIKDALNRECIGNVIFTATDFWPANAMTNSTKSFSSTTDVRYWELDSSLILPPVSSSMELFDVNGHPVVRGVHRQRIVAREDAYASPELHYNAADLAPLGGFDVARTFENFGFPPTQEYSRIFASIVVSNRFYNICQKHRMNANWQPVWVDAD